MRKIILIMVLLCVYTISYSQMEIDTASFKDGEAYMANNYNVLLPVEVIKRKNRTDTVISICTKNDLFSYIVPIYGGGGFANYKGKTYLITAKHCLEKIKNKKYKVVMGIDSSDIVAIDLDTLLGDYPELVDIDITSGNVYFSYFHLLGTKRWKYCMIEGEMFIPGVFDFFFTDQRLEMELDKFRGTIKTNYPPVNRKINFFGTICNIKSNNRDEIIDTIRESVKSRRTPFMKYYEGMLVMPIDHLLYDYLPGSSGSFVFSENGYIVAISARRGASAGREKRYAVFVHISKITKALEIYLKEKEEKK